MVMNENSTMNYVFLREKGRSDEFLCKVCFSVVLILP